MNSFIKSNIVKPTNQHAPTRSVFSVLNEKDLDDLKKKILGSERDFVRLVPKTSMLNKTIDELKDILATMIMEESNGVKLYKTAANYVNKLEKPEQPSLVFINDVFAFSGYPYSIELTPDRLNTLDFDIVTKCRFFEANEGTVLRVFNANGKWYTITNKKIDAFCSKWAAKTETFGCHLAKSIFVLLNPDHTGDMPNFDDIITAKEYVNQTWSVSLDPTKRYFFLLKSSKEEKIVCDVDMAILNIGVIDENNRLSLDEMVKLSQNNTPFGEDASRDVIVPNPVEHHISSLDELIRKINNIDPKKCAGLLAIFKTDFSGNDIEADIEQHIHIKLLNPTYKYRQSLRGNIPSLRFRFFQLTYLSNREMQLNPSVQPSYIEDFKQLYYPQCENMLEPVWVVVQDLFKKYQSKYVKHENVYEELLPKADSTLRIIHNEYLISKQPTTKHKISDILSYLEPEKLNQLVREYEYEIKKQNKPNQQLLNII
jgi:hypothetical protein